MTNSEAAQILADFNKWRRGHETSTFTLLDLSPKEIGLALDLAVKALKKK